MTHEVESLSVASGIERRDFLRRSAIVGGMVWAAPIIQSVGSPAFAFTPPTECKDISYVAFIVTNFGSGTYKFEYNDGTGQCPASPDVGFDSAPGGCGDVFDALDDSYKQEWQQATQSDSVAGTVTVDCNPPLDTWCITAPDGYYVKWALVKSGQGADGKCVFVENTQQANPWCVSSC
jgi:hypothetical protein